MTRLYPDVSGLNTTDDGSGVKLRFRSPAYDVRAYLSLYGITARVNDVDCTVKNSISVFDTGGYPSTICHGRIGPTLQRCTVQILIRCPDKPTAVRNIEQILTLLDGITNTTLNGTYYLSVDCTTQAAYLGRVETGEGETNEWSVNFQTTKQR